MNTTSLFTAGKQAGLTDMEVYFTRSDNFSCKVFEGNVDSYAVSQTQGLSIRGLFEGKMGYTYTEQVADFNPERLIQTVIDQALYLETQHKEYLYDQTPEYPSLSLYDESFETVSPEQKIDFLKKVEKAALEYDTRVKSVSYCSFANGTTTSTLENTHGVSLTQRANYAYTYLNVVVFEDHETKEASTFLVSTDFNDYHPQTLAQTVVTEALSKLKSHSITSGNYPIVLSSKVASELVDAMSTCFSAESVLKKLSLLENKCDTKVASTCLTLVDDPHLKNGLGSCAFDGEGVPTRYKTIIESGILKSYLHNLATAHQLNVEPTGNGMRSSYKSSIYISPSNLYIKPGNFSLEQLLAKATNGLYITSIAGIHAGLNTVSGDFSLAASGYYISNETLAHPISDITISGNFFTLLQQIEAIGNQLNFNLSAVGSPALYVSSLTVSGE